MSSIENDNTHLKDRHPAEGWDPALWSIGTVIGVAILYVACLS